MAFADWLLVSGRSRIIKQAPSALANKVSNVSPTNAHADRHVKGPRIHAETLAYYPHNAIWCPARPRRPKKPLAEATTPSFPPDHVPGHVVQFSRSSTSIQRHMLLGNELLVLGGICGRHSFNRYSHSGGTDRLVLSDSTLRPAGVK
jgi:hypothetical protein